jgi:ketosteroid isomerase-like protein
MNFSLTHKSTGILFIQRLMKKLVFFFLISFSCKEAGAQNAEPLINAEKEFESTCLQKGIRDGFLAWVDPNGIDFTEKGPSNAKQRWASYPPFEGIFSWSPSYAEMSISGDWGYTTGHFDHRPKSISDSVDGAGQYTTVWHKNTMGEWKYLIDIGNNHVPVRPEKTVKTISIRKYPATEFGDSAGLAEMEKKFIGMFEKDIHAAYQTYGSDSYLLNTSGHMPVISADSAVVLINRIFSPLLYHPYGVFLSEGRDMGVIYGRFSVQDKSGNYIRLWRFEEGGWKIALEVIRL